MPVRDVRFDILADDRTRAAFASVRRNLGDTRRQVSGLSSELTRASSFIGSVGKSFAGGLGIGFLAANLAELPAAARQAVSELDDLGDAAERAGVSGEKLQVMRYALEQTTGSAEAADDGLQKFAKTVGDLATTGKGSGADAFRALGISIRDTHGDLKTQEQLLGEVADKFPRLKNESQATAIATRLFGREAGPAMVAALRGGQVGLQAYEDHLRSIGGLISGDVLEKADVLDKKFKDVGLAIGTAFKVAVVEVADAVSAIIGEMQRLAASIPKPIDPAAVGAAAGKLIADPAGSRLDRGFASLPSGADAILLQRILGSKSFRDALGGSAIDANLGSEDAAAAVAKTLATEKKAVDELIASLQEELRLVGASDAQKRISNELRQAGASATDEQKAAITSLVEQIDAETKAHQALVDRLDTIRDVSAGVLSSFDQELLRTHKLSDAAKAGLQDLLQAMIRLGEQKLILSLLGAQGTAGGGLISGLLGSLFGGARAGGGSIDPGKLYIAGERGPELIVPRAPGQVIPAGQWGGGPQRVEVVARVEPSPLFNATIEHRSNDAEQRGAARAPALARDNSRRFGTP